MRGVNNNLESLWKMQKGGVVFRRPRQMLSNILVVLVFAVLQSLVLFQRMHQCAAVLATSGLGYGVYVGFATGVLGWALVAKYRKGHSDRSAYLSSWLYRAFDMFSVATMAFFSLSIALLSVEMAGLGSIVTGILLLYALWVLLCSVFAAYQVLRPRPAKARLRWEVRWAIATPIFFVVLGVMVVPMLHQSGSVNQSLVILSGLFLIISFVLILFWVPMFVFLVILACGGIPPSQEVGHGDVVERRDKQVFPGEQDLLRDISGWLEPHEKMYRFTVGRYQGTSVNIVLVLTNKYIRLASVEGGKNIPLSEVRRIEWLNIQSCLRINIAPSGAALNFMIWGKEWKKRAKEIAEEWRKLEATSAQGE